MSHNPYPPLPAPGQHLAPFANGHAYTQPYHDINALPVESYASPASDTAHVQNNDGHSASKESAARTNRLRKACDSCSIRKVKCDEAGPPCRACAALEIPCTYERPSRRRGPPNKHAEAIKRQRLESYQPPTSPYATDGSPPSYIPAAPPQASPHQAILCADSICPIELVELLIDDFFAFVHPLVPFPHEPSFREAFRQRKDIHDRSFLALVAGMVGALVAQVPGQPKKHLKAMGKPDLFRHAFDFVDHCRKVISEARGPGYLERPDLNVYDAATSYFLLCMCGFLDKWSLADLYLGECNTIIRALGFYRPRPAYPSSTFGRHAYSGAETDNFIDEEIGRRIFWTVYVTVRSSRTFDGSIGDIPILPPTPTSSYPPMPLEVDDQYIHRNYIEHQPLGIVSNIAAFNINIRIYKTVDPLVSLEASYSVDHVYDVERQKRVLRDCMRRVKSAIDNAPEELLVWPGLGSRSPTTNIFLKREHTAAVAAQGDSRSTGHSLSDYEEGRRRIGYEIQKANIHVSYLSSRSYFFEKYWVLCESSGSNNPANNPSHLPPGARSPSAFAYRSSSATSPPSNATTPNSTSSGNSQEIRAERESIATDLLNVLSKLQPVHMEPNSVSFCMKVRSIASTLLPGPQHTGGLADDGLSAYYLRSFLGILVDLEKMGGHARADAAIDDAGGEMESRGWAGLREYQKEFASRHNSV